MCSRKPLDGEHLPVHTIDSGFDRKGLPEFSAKQTIADRKGHFAVAYEIVVPHGHVTGAVTIAKEKEFLEDPFGREIAGLSAKCQLAAKATDTGAAA